MNSPYVLLSLLWRRSTLAWLPGFAIVAATFVIATLDPAAWSNPDVAFIRLVPWPLLVLGPALVGMLVASSRLQLQHTTLGWTLPGVRRGLTVGTLVVGVPIAAGAALLVSRAHGWPAAFVVFPLTLFWFSLPAAFIDVALPGPLRWMAVGLLAIAAVASRSLAAFVEHQPVVVATAALAGVVALLWTQHSARLARLRPFRWSVLSGHAGRRLFWSRGRAPSRLWKENLQTDALGPWLRASAFEMGHSLPPFYALRAMLPALLAHVWHHPFMLLIGLWTASGVHIAGLTYPLSRSRRATLAYCTALADATATFLTMALAVVALSIVDFPVLPFAAEMRRASMWPTLGLGFAFAPIAQWTTIRSAAAGLRGPTRLDVGDYVRILCYLVVAGVGAMVIRDLPQDVVVPLIAATAVVVQAAFWLVLRRFYARVDLGRTI